MEAFYPPNLASVPQAYPASAALCFHFVFQVLKIDCEIGEGTGNIEERFQSISVGKYATSNQMSLKTCINHCELELRERPENPERAVASRVHAKRNHGTKSPLIPE